MVIFIIEFSLFHMPDTETVKVSRMTCCCLLVTSSCYLKFFSERRDERGCWKNGCKVSHSDNFLEQKTDTKLTLIQHRSLTKKFLIKAGLIVEWFLSVHYDQLKNREMINEISNVATFPQL